MVLLHQGTQCSNIGLMRLQFSETRAWAGPGSGGCHPVKASVTALEATASPLVESLVWLTCIFLPVEESCTPLVESASELFRSFQMDGARDAGAAEGWIDGWRCDAVRRSFVELGKCDASS